MIQFSGLCVFRSCALLNDCGLRVKKLVDEIKEQKSVKFERLTAITLHIQMKIDLLDDILR